MLLLAVSANTCEAGTQVISSPDGYDLSREAVDRIGLPGSLAEVSGLAVDAEGRLFAHDDEVGVVYELDRNGDVVRRFRVGNPTTRADFEGIAALDNRLYLITSAGSLLSLEPGADRSRVPFERTRTGIGPRCEIEGLAEDPVERRLLVVCKQPHDRALAEQVTVFALSPEGDQAEVVLSVPWERIRAAGGSRAFYPSGIAITPDRERLFIVSARQRALLEVSWSGDVLGLHPLGRWHRQPEGIAFSSDGSLLISDEGAGGSPRLSVYPQTGSP